MFVVRVSTCQQGDQRSFWEIRMRMHPSLYPLFGLVWLFMQPELLARVLGTAAPL